MRIRSAVVVVVASLTAACAGADEQPARTSPTTRSSTPSPSGVSSPTPAAVRDVFVLARRLEARDPEALTAALVSAERAIRSDAADVTQPARIQQAMYRQLVRTPAWRARVYELVPDGLIDAVKANVQAGAELRALTEPRDELPPWRIEEPPPAERLRAAYDAAAEAFGIGWEYLAAIHLSETRMGRIRGTSVAGAKGPMQFLPSTWAAYGKGDINDPEDAIMAAARYLKAHGAPDKMSSALFAYNHSDHYVRAITLYASVMRDDERAYRGYHAWQVYYRTTRGDALLYEGWPTR
jgi:hypothetical protein